jgi:hypothetical protein
MQESLNFGQLYRAALAETDPKRKTNLLREVQSVLIKWHDEERPPAEVSVKADDSSAA